MTTLNNIVCRPFLLMVNILCLFLAVTPAAAQYFRAINCGQHRIYTSPTGDIYETDTGYSLLSGYGFIGGEAMATNTMGINGGVDGMGALYKNQREGSFSYLFDLPNGQYALTLFFAEQTYHWRGFRTFSVAVEGDTIIRDLDIYSHVGLSYAYPLRFLAACGDGQMNIDFLPGIAGGTLSAVSVRQIFPDSNPPAAPQRLVAFGGYKMNILFWNWTTDGDFVGYRVDRRNVPGGNWQTLTASAYPISSYLDRDVVTGNEYEYKITAEDLWGNVSDYSSIESAVPEPLESSNLIRVNLDISDSNLIRLNTNVYSNEYVEVDFTIEGEYFSNSQVRYRGNYTRSWAKKSYKVKLPEEMTYDGLNKLSFKSEKRDPSLMKEYLSYLLFTCNGCFCPRNYYVNLSLNDDYQGVYLHIEEIDNDFLRARRLSTAGNLYECCANFTTLGGANAYRQLYPKVNNDSTGWEDIVEFIVWVNRSSSAEFHNLAGEYFAIDEYLDMYVVLVVISEFDFTRANYFAYANPVDGRWYFFSWDHDAAFLNPSSTINQGTIQSPTQILDSWNMLLTKVLDDELFRYVYCKKLFRFINNVFTEEFFRAKVDSLYDHIYVDVLRDVNKFGYERPNDFLNKRNYMESFAGVRISYLLSEIPAYITNPDLTPYFRFNEIQTNNRATIPDIEGDYDPWLEIYNLAPVELDLEGFTLRYGAQSWTLPCQAVIDDYGYLILWLDGEPEEGELHSPFLVSNIGGSLQLDSRTGSLSDSVAFPIMDADRVWARSIDGRGDWNGNLTPSPGSTNNPPPDPSGLRINEFLALNNSVNRDSAGDYDDWVEIYNPGEDSIPLGGLYLTDDFTIPTCWVFPETTLVPGGFLLIWCDDEIFEGRLHTNFRLDGDGESIGLFDRDASTPIDTLTFGPQEEDISFGRYPDGGDNWRLMDPTPEAPNVNSAVESGESEGEVPSSFALYRIYPNPFNSLVFIRFDIPRLAEVKLAIYDILGREVAVLAKGYYSVGTHQAVWDASKAASGVYFARLEAGDYVHTQKLLLLK